MFIDATTEQQFSGEKVKTIIVDANGGSVVIDAKNSAGVYVTSDTITADFVGVIETHSLTLRFTIAGGATVELS